MATGNVKLMTSVQVNRIVLNDDHRSVSHLEATRNGEDLEIYGKKFVISAGSVNTAALLLRSGVANSSDQVGRNFMMHNNSHIAAVDMRRKNAAVSVGIIDGVPMLDLCYEEDVRAGTDMNVVVAGDGRFIEVQGTAEGEPFDRALLNQLLDLAVAGCSTLSQLQKDVLAQ